MFGTAKVRLKNGTAKRMAYIYLKFNLSIQYFHRLRTAARQPVADAGAARRANA